MNYRTLAISALALGLLAPVGAMAHDRNNCSEEQSNRKEYSDCLSKSGNISGQFGASVSTDNRFGTDEDQTRNNLGDSADKINN